METSDNSSNYSGGSRNTPEVKSSGLYKTLVIVFIVAVALIAIPITVNKLRVEKISKVKKVTNQTESVYQSTTVISIPDTYTEYHFLKKGSEPIRIIVPDGYKCDFYGGGKKYYHQAQNSKKEVWGGDSCPTKHFYPHAKYADISFYNEEITVTCVFTKQ